MCLAGIDIARMAAVVGSLSHAMFAIRNRCGIAIGFAVVSDLVSNAFANQSAVDALFPGYLIGIVPKIGIVPINIVM